MCGLIEGLLRVLGCEVVSQHLDTLTHLFANRALGARAGVMSHNVEIEFSYFAMQVSVAKSKLNCEFHKHWLTSG